MTAINGAVFSVSLSSVLRFGVLCWMVAVTIEVTVTVMVVLLTLVPPKYVTFECEDGSFKSVVEQAQLVGIVLVGKIVASSFKPPII